MGSQCQPWSVGVRTATETGRARRAHILQLKEKSEPVTLKVVVFGRDAAKLDDGDDHDVNGRRTQ